jgi:hypothetical protein
MALDILIEGLSALIGIDNEKVRVLQNGPGPSRRAN